MRLLSTLLTFFLAVAASSSLPAHAGAQDGVRCPSGYTAAISNGAKKLVCSKVDTYSLPSICAPVGVTNMELTISPLKLDPVGRNGGIDQCLAVGGGVTKVDSVMPPPPPGYPPATQFKRVVDPTKADVFKATVTHYSFPQATSGVLIFTGDPAAGVVCPAGYDGDTEFAGQGIRCDKYDGSPREADCDIGWTVVRDKNGSEDRCLGLNEGPTKPAGMTKIQHDAERSLPTVGWILNKKSGVDTWQRKVYHFPVAP